MGEQVSVEYLSAYKDVDPDWANDVVHGECVLFPKGSLIKQVLWTEKGLFTTRGCITREVEPTEQFRVFKMIVTNGSTEERPIAELDGTIRLACMVESTNLSNVYYQPVRQLSD